MKFLQALNSNNLQLQPGLQPLHYQKKSVENIHSVASGVLSFHEAEQQQNTHRTVDGMGGAGGGNSGVSNFHHNHSKSQGHAVGQQPQQHVLNSSFRVENRRARPKIVQNVVDQGNAFFSKQASIINSSHKCHRRMVSSPGTEFLFLNKNENILNNSAIVQRESKLQVGPDGQEAASAAADRDQFNFTFFKERGAAPTDPSSNKLQSQLLSDSHVNVSNLLNSAQS